MLFLFKLRTDTVELNDIKAFLSTQVERRAVNVNAADAEQRLVLFGLDLCCNSSGSD